MSLCAFFVSERLISLMVTFSAFLYLIVQQLASAMVTLSSFYRSFSKPTVNIEKRKKKLLSSLFQTLDLVRLFPIVLGPFLEPFPSPCERLSPLLLQHQIVNCVLFAFPLSLSPLSFHLSPNNHLLQRYCSITNLFLLFPFHLLISFVFFLCDLIYFTFKSNSCCSPLTSPFSPALVALLLPPLLVQLLLLSSYPMNYINQRRKRFTTTSKAPM